MSDNNNNKRKLIVVKDDNNKKKKSKEGEEVEYILETDGASQQDSTHAGCGYVIYQTKQDSTQKTEIDSGYKYIGSQTNNVAEYTALLLGIKAAMKLNIKKLSIRADSNLVIGQVFGINNKMWKINEPHLKPFVARSQFLLNNNFDSVNGQHIPREENGRADKLSKKAIKDYLKSLSN